MRRVLIIGAGRSASSLVKYLLDKSDEENIEVIIVDINLENAQKLAQNHINATVIEFDIFDIDSRQAVIRNSDIVISMLPARFHMEVARDCVLYGNKLVTASYVSKELMELDKAVISKG